MIDTKLIEKLCRIHSPSGNEIRMKDFILDFVANNSAQWTTKPEILHGHPFQNCLVLIFGKPVTAIYAHIDSIGFTVRYNNEVIKIGSPKISPGIILTGTDSKGKIAAKLYQKKNSDTCFIDFDRQVDRGTDLVFNCQFKEDGDFIQSCYLDNRVGVYVALELCKTLQNAAVVFSCYEEHGGGITSFIAGYLFNRFGTHQALISDVTWITDGISHGKGAVISLRDSGIPRKIFTDRIIHNAIESKINFQLEVESNGGSDGNEIQHSPYPIDWCFIGPGESNVHSPDERIFKQDIVDTILLYKSLLNNL